MKKFGLAMLMGACLSMPITKAAELKMGDVVETASGLNIQRDQFSNIWIAPETINKENIAKYVQANATKEEGNAFIVMVGDDLHSSIVPILKNNGFKFHAHNTRKNKLEYALRNGSSMPHYMTGIGGGQGVILREKDGVLEALVAAQKFSSRIGLVGGYQDPNELTTETMCREAKEEANLDIEVVYKIADTDRRNANRYGVNDKCDYYICRVKGDSDKVIAQKKELKSIEWLPVTDILDGTRKCSRMFKIILEHYVNNPNEHTTLTGLDYTEFKKDKADRDQSHIMIYNFYSKPKNAKL